MKRFGLLVLLLSTVAAAGQDTSQPLPQTCDAAVDVLMATMTDENLDLVRQSAEADLSQFNFGLGTVIRNDFGLYRQNPALAVNCTLLFPDMARPQHPDTQSMMIITHLWRRLQAEP